MEKRRELSRRLANCPSLLSLSPQWEWNEPYCPALLSRELILGYLPARPRAASHLPSRPGKLTRWEFIFIFFPPSSTSSLRSGAGLIFLQPLELSCSTQPLLLPHPRPTMPKRAAGLRGSQDYLPPTPGDPKRSLAVWPSRFHKTSRLLPQDQPPPQIMVQVKSDDKEHLWRGISKRNKGKKSLESNARVHLVNGPSERHYYQDGNSYNLNLKVSSSNLPGCPLLLNITTK